MGATRSGESIHGWWLVFVSFILWDCHRQTKGKHQPLPAIFHHDNMNRYFRVVHSQVQTLPNQRVLGQVFHVTLCPPQDW